MGNKSRKEREIKRESFSSKRTAQKRTVTLKAAKQIIPHVHVHIIPRYANKGTVWTKRGIPSDSELKDLSEKIKMCF